MPGLISSLSEEATRGLAEEGDKYIATISAGATYVSAAYTTAKSTIVAEVEKGFAQLYANNCKVSDKFYLEVSPAFYTTLRPAMTELSTANPELMKKGAVGMYGNAEVYIDNCLYDDETNIWCMLRTDKAIAYAEQISKVEAYRPEDSFSDAIKGLLVFGAKIVRPEQLYIIKTVK